MAESLAIERVIVGGREQAAFVSTLVMADDIVRLHGTEFHLTLNFEGESTDSPTVHMVVNGQTLGLTFVNFANPAGTVWTDTIGKLDDGREVSLTAYIQRVAERGWIARLVHLSVWIQSAAA